MLYETVETLNGNRVTRIKSSFFYWASLISFVFGIYLISQEILFGAALSITLAPGLLMYPPVRFLFGGKDSVVAVVATGIFEEVLKAKIGEILGDKKKKRGRSRKHC